MNDETPPETKEKPKKRQRKVRPVRRRFGFWVPVWILFLSVVLVYASLVFTGRSLNAPRWLATQAENKLNESMPSARIRLGRIALEVDEKGVPTLALRNVGIFDDRGAEVARLNSIQTRFSLEGMLRGEIQPTYLGLTGAQMTVRRRKDGQFDLSFGGGTEASGTLPGVLDAVDDIFAQSTMANVERVDADALTLTLEDGRSGRLWKITQGSIQLRPLQDNLDFSMSFEVFNGTEELAKTTIGITTDKGSSAASVGVQFENAAARDIALQAPALSFLGVLDAPIGGSLRADFTTDGALGSLAGALEIGNGALQPSPQTKPVRFDTGKAYFRFHPRDNKISFSEVSVRTGAAGVQAQGHAYLREFDNAWPSTLLGQFSFTDLVAAPDGLFDVPVEFAQGAVDFRMRLDPFSIDIGQAVLVQDDEKFIVDGRIDAGEKGWEVSTDVTVNEISHARLLSMWPIAFAPNTRNWLTQNLQTGLLKDIRAAIRWKPEEPIRTSLGYQFKDATVRYLKSLPPIENAAGYSTIDGKTFSLVLEEGEVTAPQGGQIDIAGSTMVIGDVTNKPARAEFRLAGRSTTTGALSLLDEPPFKILKKTDYGPDLAQGQAEFLAQFAFDMKKRIQLPDVEYSVRGVLRNVVSNTLVKGRTISAAALDLTADPDAVSISGPLNLGNVAATINWVQKLGPEHAGKSNVSGQVVLSQAFVDEFSIGLPGGALSGRGAGKFNLDLEKDQAPGFSLESDLRGIGLKIAPLGWSKSTGQSGQLVVSGRLGTRPIIDRLEISAAGLNASGGKVSFTDSGQLRAATFSRVTAGGWLDAPIALNGRGAGVVPAVAVQGGSIDVRRTSFASGSGRSGQGGPINLALDRLVISEGITLTGFTGELDSRNGMSGDFRARVNGGARITGQLAPERNGTAIRIQSGNAGGVLRSAGFLENARGGDFDLTLRPQPTKGVYRGTMNIKNTRATDVPALAELISAISVVGLLDQLSGPGISFSEVNADFTLSPKFVNVHQSSAVGPSLGISLDGVYDLTTKRMNMQGVLSPVYFLNGIGQIFSRRGEGLFGFNYRLSGTTGSPQVRVNPLSILTPGMFRDIFRAPPPEVGQ